MHKIKQSVSTNTDNKLSKTISNTDKQKKILCEH